MAAVMVVIAFRRGDGTLAAGLQSGGRTFISVLPLLLSVFVIVGLASFLVPRELIARWLGESAGLRGILLGTALGALSPPSVFVAFPLGATMYQAGAGIGAVVAYLSAWALFSIFRLPLEYSFLGAHLLGVRILATVAVPPLAGIVANFFFD
jgi:uncharacterized membrane protein YraQ (UPF0718 family)